MEFGNGARKYLHVHSGWSDDNDGMRSGSRYTLWATDGSARVLPAIEFVTGNNQNILGPGELLRKVNISGRALNRRYATRRFTLTKAQPLQGLRVGTHDSTGEVLITVSAATSFPVHVRFPEAPSAQQVVAELDARIPDELYFDLIRMVVPITANT